MALKMEPFKSEPVTTTSALKMEPFKSEPSFSVPSAPPKQPEAPLQMPPTFTNAINSLSKMSAPAINFISDMQQQPAPPPPQPDIFANAPGMELRQKPFFDDAPGLSLPSPALNFAPPPPEYPVYQGGNLPEPGYMAEDRGQAVPTAPQAMPQMAPIQKPTNLDLTMMPKVDFSKPDFLNYDEVNEQRQYFQNNPQMLPSKPEYLDLSSPKELDKYFQELAGLSKDSPSVAQAFAFAIPKAFQSYVTMQMGGATPEILGTLIAGTGAASVINENNDKIFKSKTQTFQAKRKEAAELADKLINETKNSEGWGLLTAEQQQKFEVSVKDFYKELKGVKIPTAFDRIAGGGMLPGGELLKSLETPEGALPTEMEQLSPVEKVVISYAPEVLGMFAPLINKSQIGQEINKVGELYAQDAKAVAKALPGKAREAMSNTVQGVEDIATKADFDVRVAGKKINRIFNPPKMKPEIYVPEQGMIKPKYPNRPEPKTPGSVWQPPKSLGPTIDRYEVTPVQNVQPGFSPDTGAPVKKITGVETTMGTPTRVAKFDRPPSISTTAGSPPASFEEFVWHKLQNSGVSPKQVNPFTSVSGKSMMKVSPKVAFAIDDLFQSVGLGVTDYVVNALPTGKQSIELKTKEAKDVVRVIQDLSDKKNMIKKPPVVKKEEAVAEPTAPEVTPEAPPALPIGKKYGGDLYRSVQGQDLPVTENVTIDKYLNGELPEKVDVSSGRDTIEGSNYPYVIFEGGEIEQGGNQTHWGRLTGEKKIKEAYKVARYATDDDFEYRHVQVYPNQESPVDQELINKGYVLSNPEDFGISSEVPQAPPTAEAPVKYSFKQLDPNDRKEVESKTFYHGTKAPINSIEEASPGEYGTARNLFGDGLYLTDNPDVAKGYAKTKGKGAEGKVLEANLKDVNLLDFDKPLPEKAVQIFKDVLHNFSESLYNVEGETDAYKLWDKLREAMSDEHLPHSEVLEIYSDIADLLGYEGFDGIKHTGNIMGKDTYGKHNVAIIFPNSMGKVVSPSSQAPPTAEAPVPVQSKDKFIQAKDVYKHEKSFYFDEEGKKIASSREKPQGESPWKVGEWKIDDFDGIHGHEIEQLRELDPSQLQPGESMEMDKIGDIETYYKWAKEGKEIPPISVVENNDGKLVIINGHRRAAAAKKAGIKIKAWVSPSAEIDMLDSNGKPIKTGLTAEMAIEKAIKNGEKVSEEVINSYPKLKEKYGKVPDAPAGQAPEVEVKKTTPDTPITPTKYPAKSQIVKDNGDVQLFGVKQEDLHLDPKRFQYKLQTSEKGVEKGSDKVFNPRYAGEIHAWRDPSDSKLYIVNGHHRYNWLVEENARRVAKGLKPFDMPSVIVLENMTASEARSFGARINIAEGKGKVIDAATYFREKNMSKKDVEAEGIGGDLAENGHAISQLSPSLWNRYRDTFFYGAGADGKSLSENVGAAIGRAFPKDDAKQMAVWDLAKDDSPIKLKTVEEYIKSVKDSPVEVTEELTLFGTETTRKDLTKEKVKLVVSIRDDIKRQGSAHGFVSKGGRAKKLEAGTKTKIDVEASKKIAEKSDRLLAVLDKSAYTPSEISTILNEGAKDINRGVKLGVVKERIMEKLTPLLEKEAQNVFRGKEAKTEEITLFGESEGIGQDKQSPTGGTDAGTIEKGVGEGSEIQEKDENKPEVKETPLKNLGEEPKAEAGEYKAIKAGSNIIFTDGASGQVVSFDDANVEFRPAGQDDTISIPRAEFNDRILSVGEPKTEKLRAGITPADLDPGTVQKIVRWIKKWMSPTGALEPDAARESLVAREAIKEMEATAAIMGKKLTKGLTEKQQQAIGKVVIGDYPDAGTMATAEGIPLKEAKDLFKLGRESADIMTYFGEELAKRGLLTKESLAKYGGIYMGRLFRKWEYRHMPTELLNEIAEMLLKKGDPKAKKWAEVAMRLADREKQFAFEQTIQDEIRKAANDPALSSDTKLPGFTKVNGQDWIYTEYGDLGLAGRWVRNDVYKTLKASIDNARLSRQKLGKWMNAKSSDLGEGMDMSYLKQRKDLPDEYREFLGEILEPAYPIARRIQQMGEDLAKYDFYDFMAKNYSSANNLGGKLKKVEGKAFGNLQDRYMLPEYVDAIKEYEEMSEIFRGLNKGLRFWKEVHTVWNPGTHTRNVQNNIVNYGIIYGPSAFEEIAPAIGNFVNDDTFLEIAKRANVFGGNYFEDKGGAKQFIDNFADIKDVKGFLKKVLEVANVRAHAKAAYKFEDDFFKLMAFRRELRAAGIDIEQLTADWNNMTFREQREWIRNIGAKPSIESRNAITSYDRMGKFPRFLTQYPGSFIPVAGDPFFSFPYSFFTRSMPKIFRQGTGSRLRFLLALLIPAAVAAYTWQKNQTTAKKEIAQRPEYMRKTSDLAKRKGMDEKYIPLVSMLFDGYLPLPFKDKHGRNLYWDFSNTLAWQDIAKVDENTALVKDPISRTITEISTNKNLFTNQKIWLDSDSEEVIFRKKMMHVWKAAAPSFAPGGYSWEKWKAAYRGAEDYYGRTRDMGTVAVDTLLGIKITPVEPQTTAYYEIKKDRESLEELWSKTRQVENLRDRKTLSPKEAEKELIYLKERIRTVAKNISENLENQEVQRAELVRVKSLIIKLAKTGYISKKEATDMFRKMTQRAKGLKGVPPKRYDYGRIKPDKDSAAKRP